MNITIRFFAHLKDIVGIKNQISLQVEKGSNVLDLLNKLFTLYDIKNHIMRDNQTLKKWVTILINGREIRFLLGLQTKIKENDNISIFPPIVGG
ncbi:MAG: MoaD family protein [Promethearchaeota archaeon]|nr:MAG: MoaD family protein [Candidatus Lokiarchaeota archaeon]